ncbi:glycoside hydrolase family 10 protein [Parapedobacter sp. 10938]|uniref:glycoside hydrolase family 10 protein n=1 Tax=Parapedobacter flavus TaxID=3110225 RepID=UPI002DBE1D2C|nr:family 10 glycosylhydrolase [Parapedobacter sp. 10938]MEC3881868.1 family 10 glycosylhydrolase [Parapedobacter sp. 10938]
MRYTRAWIGCVTVFFLSFIGSLGYCGPVASGDTPPKRELRGAWVATVVNIDWPSADNLSTAAQQQELIRHLDNHQRAGINAVFLQIRPTADAFYAKSSEPWSRFLTGKPGRAPEPFYDPLEFAINEAHKRGMELHAWINPYRATFDLVAANTTNDHITRLKPEWFFVYGGKKLFNPGIPQVRDYIVGIVTDIVRNYDIDGVHFDDYFYPYPAGGRSIPDAETFRKYPNVFKNIADWRRNNVNLLIQMISESVHREKEYIKFGVSPFGIWDNKKDHPDGSASSGFSGYRQLYADALKWLEEGWVDYINPQIYFPFGHPAAPYEVLADWWAERTHGRHLYIGHAAYRATENGAGWRDRSQIPNQVRYARQHAGAQGSIYYSAKHITNNVVGLRDSLQYNLYRYKSLPPTMPWLDSIAPEPPFGLLAQVAENGTSVILQWQPGAPAADGEAPYGYVVYRFNEGEPLDVENPQNILHITYDHTQMQYTDNLTRKNGHYRYVVTTIDRLKNESLPSNSRELYIE